MLRVASACGGGDVRRLARPSKSSSPRVIVQLNPTAIATPHNLCPLRKRPVSPKVCRAATALGGGEEFIEENEGSQRLSPYEEMCGFYKLSDKDRDTFGGFVKAVSQAVRWIVLVGSLKICYSFWCLSQKHLPVSLPDVFLLLESYTLAAVLLMGRFTFTKLASVPKNRSDIPIILEGMNRLGIAFLQIAAFCGAVTLLQAMQAAVKCPPVIHAFSGLMIVLAALRCVGLSILVWKYNPGSGKLAKLAAAMQMGKGKQEGYSFLDRLSLRISASSLLGYTFMSSSSVKNSNEYEFSEMEENIIRMCIDAMRVASLAMLLEVISYVMLGACAVFQKEWKDLFDVCVDLIDSSFLCGITFTTSNYFDRVISSQGRDITQLVEGFGENGMIKLFEEFSKLMKGLFFAGVATALITNGPLGVYVEQASGKASVILKSILDKIMHSSI